MPITKSCIICSKKFNVFPSSIDKKYCSYGCYWSSPQLIQASRTAHLGKSRSDMIGNKLTLGRPSWNKGIYGMHLSPGSEFKKGDPRITGKNHYLWKGDDVGKSALHGWVKRHLGIPKECWHCGNRSVNIYDWHNKSGKYKRDLNDWVRLCRRCHYRYDRKMLEYINGKKGFASGL